MIKFEFPEEEFDIASGFSRMAELKAVNCCRGEFATNTWVDEVKAENIIFQHNGKFKYDIEKNILFVEVEFTAEYRLGTDQPPLNYVKAAFLLVYQLVNRPPVEEEIRDVLFSSFAKISCLHQVWPYWREFCDASARRMGLSGYLAAPLVISAQKAELVPPKKRVPKKPKPKN